MTSVKNNMDNKSDFRLLVIQATIESNRQYYDEKMIKFTGDLIAMITSMMDLIKFSKYSPDKK